MSASKFAQIYYVVALALRQGEEDQTTLTFESLQGKQGLGCSDKTLR